MPDHLTAICSAISAVAAAVAAVFGFLNHRTGVDTNQKVTNTPTKGTE